MVRVHCWLDGLPVPSPASRATAAGQALAVIRRLGSAMETRPSGTLRWWARQPCDVVGRLRHAGLLTADHAAAARDSLAQAMRVITAGERLPGSWIYTHCDHKPENSMVCGDRVALLDWDECGYCHRRLEAVESALRWAGGDSGEPSHDVFAAFLSGYQSGAGRLGPLVAADFAMWMAALAGWFSFTGARPRRLRRPGGGTALGRQDGGRHD